MHMQSFTHSPLLLLLLLLLLCSLLRFHGTAQDFPFDGPTKYFEVTHPLPTDYQTPTCSLHVFQLDVFVDVDVTVGFLSASQATSPETSPSPDTSPSTSPASSPATSPSTSPSPSSSPATSPSPETSPSTSPATSPSLSPAISPSPSSSPEFSPSPSPATLSPETSPSTSPATSPSLSPELSPSPSPATLSPETSPSPSPATLSPETSPSTSPELSPSPSPPTSPSPTPSPEKSPSPSPSPELTPSPSPETSPSPSPSTELSPSPSPSPETSPSPSPSSELSPSPSPATSPSPSPETSPSPSPSSELSPSPSPATSPSLSPETSPSPSPSSELAPSPSPATSPSLSPETSPSPSPSSELAPSPSPATSPSPSPETSPSPSPSPELSPSPSPATSPSPSPCPETSPSPSPSPETSPSPSPEPSPAPSWSDPWAVSGYYSPPANCSGPWSAIVAEFSASISAKQIKRIAAIWFGGIEILRSSTVETVGNGAVWKVKKDVTRYASVFSKSNITASLVLKDVAEDTVGGIYRENFTGSFRVNVSLYFYGGKVSSVENGGGGNAFKSRKLAFWGIDTVTSENEGEFGLETGVLPVNVTEKEEEEGEEEIEFEKSSGILVGKETEENLISGNLLKFPSDGSSGKADNRLKNTLRYQIPADLIIPISSKGSNSSAYWFVIQNGSYLQSKEIKIPQNTYKAVLEIYVSSHANDEFWYSNPPSKSPPNKNHTVAPVKSAFRQVFASIDGLYVGSFVPFPIVYSGGIDPLFWDPIVAIGAFDLPSYDLDLTPFLGLLLNDKSHTLSLGITDATSFWYIDANLHLWLDHRSSHVTAGLVRYRAPEVRISRKFKFGPKELRFTVKAEREVKLAGWVNSSMGNLTTKIKDEFEFKNTIRIRGEGIFKEVKQKIETETKIKVQAFSELLLAKSSYETEYPLEIKIETRPTRGNAYSTKTEFSHEKEEKSSVVLPTGVFSSKLQNSQESEGQMEFQGQEVLSAMANTEQNYKYRDGGGCYIRKVIGGGGHLLEDSYSNICVEMEEL